MKFILLVALSLVFIGCSGEQKEEVKKEVVKATKVPVDKTLEITKEVEEALKDSMEEATKVASESSQKLEKALISSVDKVEEATMDLAQRTKKVIADVMHNSDRATIYKACAGCHGANGEKVALGKSKVIQGWEVSKVIDALNGYKNGTYGGAMKGLMKGQVLKLSNEDIKDVSEYISKL